MRRTIFYIVDLMLLNFGLVIGYYARKIKDWFKLMGKEIEEKEKLDKWENS